MSMKKGLVLEGGGKRAIYTAGVLDVLGEHGLYPDGVIGVSAGAVFGCSYVAAQHGRSIRYVLKYGNDYRFMSWRSWLKTGNFADVDFCYRDLPQKLDKFDNEAFMKSPVDFYVTCSNLESGNPEYIRCRDLFKEMDFLRASASLPFVSRIVSAGGKKLLDGSTTDSVPLRAFEQKGYVKNVAVLTRPAGYRKKPSRDAWLAKLVYRQYPAFVRALQNRHQMYNRELDYIEAAAKEGRALIIRPSRKIKMCRMERNPEVVRQMYLLGRRDAEAALDEVKAFWR